MSREEKVSLGKEGKKRRRGREKICITSGRKGKNLRRKHYLFRKERGREGGRREGQPPPSPEDEGRMKRVRRE